MLITNGQTSLEQVWHPHRPMKNPTLTFNLDWIIQNDDDDDGGDAGGLGSIVGGRLMLKGSPNAQDPMRRRRPAFNRYRCIYLFCTDQDQPPPPPRPLTRTITLQDTKLCSFWDHLNAIYRITDHISLFHSTVLHSAKPGQNLWLLLSCSSPTDIEENQRCSFSSSGCHRVQSIHSGHFPQFHSNIPSRWWAMRSMLLWCAHGGSNDCYFAISTCAVNGTRLKLINIYRISNPLPSSFILFPLSKSSFSRFKLLKCVINGTFMITNTVAAVNRTQISWN